MSAQAGHNTTRPDTTATGQRSGETRTGVGLSPTPSSGKPLISIITVVRNGRDVIEETIRSVLDQRYPNLEYIVIDGGSADGTVEIIKKYADRITYWTSEPDRGVYDAMNKGISHVQGNGHLFLNAGDRFVGDVLNDNLTIPSYLPVHKKDIFGTIRPVRPKDHRQGLPYCHQGIIFESKGLRFNTNYLFAADYLYYLDHGYTFLPSIKTSGHVYYDNTGLSSVNNRKRDREIADIIGARYGHFWHAVFRAKCGLKDMVRPFLRR